jgi:ParB-like nuclease domain
VTALRVIDVQVEALIPAARNSRTHSPEQISQIAGSIREFGFTNPVLMDGARGIIAGHGRVLAARKLGMAAVPCIELAHLTDTQKRAYILADNKLALNAGWDEEMVRVELEGLRAEDFDVSLTGFGAEELAALLAEGGGDEEDDAQGQTGGAGSLADRFGCPPFSVLNAREGWWQDRKRAWIALGIKSEIGRGDTEVNSHDAIPGGAGENSVYRSRKNLGTRHE